MLFVVIHCHSPGCSHSHSLGSPQIMIMIMIKSKDIVKTYRAQFVLFSGLA